MGQTHFQGLAVGADYFTPTTTVTTKAVVGAVTFTAAELLGGLILRDPAGGARADLVPSAATICAALDAPVEGTSFEFTIRNTADGNETITLTTDTGTTVTMSGTMTIAQNNSKRFLCVINSATTATIYSLGTIVH